MQTQTEVQYIVDAEGRNAGVIVPMDLWHEIASERETAYLLSSENMKRRLLMAMERRDDMSLEEVCEKLKLCS